MAVSIINHTEEGSQKTSYSAHLAGFLFGLSGGVVILKNLVVRKHEKIISAVGGVLIAAFVIFTIIWNAPTPGEDFVQDCKRYCVGGYSNGCKGMLSECCPVGDIGCAGTATC